VAEVETMREAEEEADTTAVANRTVGEPTAAGAVSEQAKTKTAELVDHPATNAAALEEDSESKNNVK